MSHAARAVSRSLRTIAAPCFGLNPKQGSPGSRPSSHGRRIAATSRGSGCVSRCRLLLRSASTTTTGGVASRLKLAGVKLASAEARRHGERVEHRAVRPRHPAHDAIALRGTKQGDDLAVRQLPPRVATVRGGVVALPVQRREPVIPAAPRVGAAGPRRRSMPPADPPCPGEAACPPGTVRDCTGERPSPAIPRGRTRCPPGFASGPLSSSWVCRASCS